MSKNLAYNFKTKKLNGIFDFGDCGFGDLQYEFSQIDLGNDFLKKIIKHYKKDNKTKKLSELKVIDHKLFSRLGFYINYLNGKEKIQNDCLSKLKKEIKEYSKTKNLK